MSSVMPKITNSSSLEKIDKLFACGVGHLVDLPQLVVVGYQSSGKSSVLHGLTGLPFPRDSVLCTRFATQITFRRSANTGITASIVPSKHASEEHQKEMKKWSTPIPANMTSAEFGKIMAKASDAMGVGPPDAGYGYAFSRDVLVLEISGPEQQHFSVIDVPGTFTRTEQGQTTKEDMALVDQMVHDYMSNPRSVMLVVVPCNVDIATQGIVERAVELDLEGIRTIGILTKPDLVDKGAESAIIDLMENRRHRLKLGWHLLKNPGQAEDSSTRNELETAFFQKFPPWCNLKKDTVGVKSLMVRLQTILDSHIKREFPKVKKEIAEQSRTFEEELSHLGTRRQTESEQRLYLTMIAQQFQELVARAIRAEYHESHFFYDNEHLRLATVVVNRCQDFAVLMNKSGHQIEFGDTSLGGGSEGESDESLEDLGTDKEALGSTRQFSNLDEIFDVLSEDVLVAAPSRLDILEWLRREYRQSRGFELATFKPELLLITMKGQAKKWRDFTLGYISDIITLVHNFVTKLLDHIVPDDRVREELMAILSDDFINAYVDANKQVDFLLHVELENLPATYNAKFVKARNKGHPERGSQAAGKFHKHTAGAIAGQISEAMSQKVGDARPETLEDTTIRDIHNILEPYYEVALDRFVDNVRMQVVDHYLISGPKSPLKLFSPIFVARLDAVQLESIAGEELIVKQTRANLEKDISLLKEGMRILRF